MSDESDKEQQESEALHRLNDMHYFQSERDDRDGDWMMECPYCNGDGTMSTRVGDSRIAIDCFECGGTGWA